jgi:hypothetical protein
MPRGPSRTGCEPTQQRFGRARCDGRSASCSRRRFPRRPTIDTSGASRYCEISALRAERASRREILPENVAPSSLPTVSSVASQPLPMTTSADDAGHGYPLLQVASLAGSRRPESYTPQHLADKILTSKSAFEGERKHVTSGRASTSQCDGRGLSSTPCSRSTSSRSPTHT